MTGRPNQRLMHERTDCWYQAAWSDEVRTAPLRRTLLGREYVVWRTDGVAVVSSAECRHRGMDLSRGRVVDGCLECPFHGWRYDGTGSCTLVPSDPPGTKIKRAAALDVVPSRESGGAIWMWSGSTAPTCDPPVTSRRTDGLTVRLRPMMLRSPFINAVENALDDAHLGFVHRRSLAVPVMPMGPRQIDVDADLRGFGVVSYDGPPITVPGPWSRRAFGSMAMTGGRFRFELGGYVRFEADYDDGTFEDVSASFTPATSSTTWVWGESRRTRATSIAGRLAHRLYLRRLSFEDADVLAGILSDSPSGYANPVSVDADAAALTFRKLYARHSRVGSSVDGDGGPASAVSRT